jgi:hypothetical protein
MASAANAITAEIIFVLFIIWRSVLSGTVGFRCHIGLGLDLSLRSSYFSLDLV